MALIKASTEGWQEQGRFLLEPQTELRKPRGKVWTHPVITGRRLYLRDQNLLYCYDVSQRDVSQKKLATRSADGSAK